TQPCALMVLVRSLHLPELLEDGVERSGRNTNPCIRDRDHQVCTLLYSPQAHLSCFRKLQCIAEEVDDNLAQPGLVRVGLSDLVGDLVQQLHSRLDQRTHRLTAGHQQLFDLELGRFHLHPSSLDLGKVQNVVDQVQEVMGTLENLGEIVPLTLRQDIA